MKSTSSLPSPPVSRRFVRWSIRMLLGVGALVVLFATWRAASALLADHRAEPQRTAWLTELQDGRVTDLKSHGLPGGGTRLGGNLDGHAFAVMLPKSWNHELIFFVHGYTLPDTPVTLPATPHDIELGQSLQGLYELGYGIAFAAYDKAGFAVESGAENTQRLLEFLRRLQPKRTFVLGMSMGGTITMAMLEQPHANVDGALVVCGVVEGWRSETAFLIDMRAVYEYFTRNTPYALPGDQRIGHSLLPTEAHSLWRVAPTLFRLNQARRVMAPVAALFKAAKKNPGGPEAKMVRNIASAAGVDAEPGTFIFPMLTIGLGMNDLTASMGGSPYGNIGKVYHADELSDNENAALNAGIQRLAASPAAQQYADSWHEAKGTFPVPLVTLHNRTDPLVPYAQEVGLANIVKASGDAGRLLQRSVPAVSAPMITTGLRGLAHCGFQKEQVLNAFEQLHEWVAAGVKPAP